MRAVEKIVLRAVQTSNSVSQRKIVSFSPLGESYRRGDALLESGPHGGLPSSSKRGLIELIV
jgi:hypothetical protein